MAPERGYSLPVLPTEAPPGNLVASVKSRGGDLADYTLLWAALGSTRLVRIAGSGVGVGGRHRAQSAAQVTPLSRATGTRAAATGRTPASTTRGSDSGGRRRRLDRRGRHERRARGVGSSGSSGGSSGDGGGVGGARRGGGGSSGLADSTESEDMEFRSGSVGSNGFGAGLRGLGLEDSSVESITPSEDDIEAVAALQASGVYRTRGNYHHTPAELVDADTAAGIGAGVGASVGFGGGSGAPRSLNPFDDHVGYLHGHRDTAYHSEPVRPPQRSTTTSTAAGSRCSMIARGNAGGSRQQVSGSTGGTTATPATTLKSRAVAQGAAEGGSSSASGTSGGHGGGGGRRLVVGSRGVADPTSGSVINGSGIDGGSAAATGSAGAGADEVDRTPIVVYYLQVVGKAPPPDFITCFSEHYNSDFLFVQPVGRGHVMVFFKGSTQNFFRAVEDYDAAPVPRSSRVPEVDRDMSLVVGYCGKRAVTVRSVDVMDLPLQALAGMST